MVSGKYNTCSQHYPCISHVFTVWEYLIRHGMIQLLGCLNRYNTYSVIATGPLDP